MHPQSLKHRQSLKHQSDLIHSATLSFASINPMMKTKYISVSLLLSLLVHPLLILLLEQPSLAQVVCQCTQYVANKFSLSRFPNAADWNNGYLQNKGFVQVTGPQVGAIAVMERNFPGADPVYGHVGIVETIRTRNNNTYISVRGANQTAGGTLFAEAGCSNVRITSFGNQVNGVSSISFWVRQSSPPTASVWGILPGFAHDISVGANGSAWIVGNDVVFGGYGIYNWTGSNWQQVSGGALRIAVDPNGLPWVVNRSANIYRRNGNNWTIMPGSAYDIGIGANGSVWVIGTDPVPGGYGIYNWTGSNWQKVSGGGLRIAVDPNGIPWVVNQGGNIYRRNSNGNGWTLMPGSAYDIGIGANGTVWVIGTDPAFGGFGIYRWTGSTWQKVDGGALGISVGPNGKPWVVNQYQNIYLRQ